MPGKHLSTTTAADAAGIARAADRLRAGGIVAVPTETVYGLAARADSADAVAEIYRAKGRPDFNPLIVHVANLAAAEQLARFGDHARALAAAFWPGPLTIVLPRRADAGLAPAVSAGLDTVAIRCPAHPVMRQLLAAVRLPLAAPSANRSGGVSPTTAAHVAASFGQDAPLILDGGPCEAGLESTIVILRADTTWQVLRPGPIGEARIAAVMGDAADVTTAARLEAPGQLSRHYAPGKPLRLGATVAEADEFMIGFGAVVGDYNLSPAGDLSAAAARLYDALHVAAAAAKPRIAVAAIGSGGEYAEAINDRLRRAAAP